jgi:hypothetical protein
VQATHLEARGRNEPKEGSNKFFNGDKGKRKFEGNGKKNASVKKEREKLSCKQISKDGHDEDHCWKLHPEKRPKNFNNKEKPNIDATVQQDLGSDSEDETRITTMGLQGKNYVGSTSSSNSAIDETQHEKERIDLFHIRVISKHTKIDTLFDIGSQANLISEDIFKKLDLETTPHPKPYPLGWICDNDKLHVTRRCKLRFVITTNYIDEVNLDVIPLDICGIVFGSPYLYDRRSIFHLHENKYHLFKNGVEYIVRENTKKMNLSLTNAGQMKRLVNASKNLVLLMTKPKDNDEEEVLNGFDTNLQSDLHEVANKNVEMFQKPRGFPPKRGIQQEILLQQGGPLPNLDMCRMLVRENVENRKQAHKLLDKSFIKPRTSPCRSPIGLVPKKYCMWQMWVDFRALNKITDMIAEGDIWKKDLKSNQAPLHALKSYVFHLVIRYKKDFYDKVVDMLTRPNISALVIFKHNPMMHKSYLE